jgi:hypothetical protein
MDINMIADLPTLRQHAESPGSGLPAADAGQP